MKNISHQKENAYKGKDDKKIISRHSAGLFGYEEFAAYTLKIGHFHSTLFPQKPRVTNSPGPMVVTFVSRGC